MDNVFITPKEVAKEIKTNINPKRAPGYLITGEILKKLPKKTIIKLTHLINAAFLLKHVPVAWKMTEVIMIPKQGKPPNEKTSYRPMSLLPIVSKLFEKLLLKRLKQLIESKNIISSHQFGFRDKHATADQIHRIRNIIEKAYERKKICSAIFLGIAQAFDKVWHVGLMNTLKNTLPRQFTQILESNITGRMFIRSYVHMFILHHLGKNSNFTSGQCLGTNPLPDVHLGYPTGRRYNNCHLR
jgi:hypothetical protein